MAHKPVCSDGYHGCHISDLNTSFWRLPWLTNHYFPMATMTVIYKCFEYIILAATMAHKPLFSDGYHDCHISVLNTSYSGGYHGSQTSMFQWLPWLSYQCVLWLLTVISMFWIHHILVATMTVIPVFSVTTMTVMPVFWIHRLTWLSYQCLEYIIFW